MTENETAGAVSETGAGATGDSGSPVTIAYLCLQATREGQASYAHVHEIINGLRRRGCTTRLFEPEYAPGDMPGAFGRAAEFLRVQGRLRRTSQDIDALYVRSHFAALPAVLWARRRGIPVVMEVNGPYDDLFAAWPWTRRLSGLFIALSRLQFRRASALITVTPQLADWLSREAPGREVSVVPNGANTDIFSPSASTQLKLPECFVVFFGALAAWQGLDTLTQAVLDSNWPDQVSLVVAGDGAQRTTIEQAISDPRVVYLGSIPYRDVAGVVARALAGLAPKNSIGGRTATGLAPLKVFETLACGTPAIVTDFPGQADLIRECGCGIVIPPEDPSALARAVADLAANPAEAAAMGRRGRESVATSHSWDSRSESTLTVILRAMARAPGHA